MTTRRGLVLPCGLLALSLATTAAGDVVTIEPVRDNTLFEDAAGSLSNGAGPVLFAGNSGQALARRALLRFDVADNVPPDATIDEVTLTLNVSNAPNTIPRTFALHRVFEDWDEGTSSTTSGGGAPATENDATWLHTFYASQLWASAGGHFASGASASQSVAGVGSYTWTDLAMKSDVQAWLDDPTTNFGWLVQSDEVTLNTARRFDSRENPVATNRPALTLRYSRTVGVRDEGARRDMALALPRPNPGGGPVRLGFMLSSRGHVRLEVKDLTGRLVTTLLEGYSEPGGHEAVWNGRDAHGGIVAAGVYFCRLIVDGRYTIARRLVMLR